MALSGCKAVWSKRSYKHSPAKTAKSGWQFQIDRVIKEEDQSGDFHFSFTNQGKMKQSRQYEGLAADPECQDSRINRAASWSVTVYSVLTLGAVITICLTFRDMFTGPEPEPQPQADQDPSLIAELLQPTCKNPSQRQEWRQLNATEKTGYIDAVKCLHSQPSSRHPYGQLSDDFPWAYRSNAHFGKNHFKYTISISNISQQVMLLPFCPGIAISSMCMKLP